jgi:hypothetical protein
MLTRILAIIIVTASVASAQSGFEGEWAGSGGVRLTFKADAAGLTGSVSEGAGVSGTMTIEQGSVTGPTARFTTSRTVNGNVIRTTWFAELRDDDTLVLSRMSDPAGEDAQGRTGRAGRAGAGGPRAGGRGGRGRGEGDGRAGRRGGEAPGRAGEPGERGRGGEAGERGRAGAGGRGRGGAPGTRGRGGEARGRGEGMRGGDLAGTGFPEVLRRVR